MDILSVASGSIAAVVAVAGLYYAPQLHRYVWMRMFAKRCRATRTLVLTYDDGPGRDSTPRLLDLLARHGARATFFILGTRATRHPEIVQQIIDKGHEIGCHGNDHLNAWRASPWQTTLDIQRAYRTLAPWAGATAMYRPPNGKITLPGWLSIRLRGAQLGWWTIDSGDSRAQLPEPRAVAERVRQMDGGIVLMHDFDRTGPTADNRHRFVLETTALLLELAVQQRLHVCPFGEWLAQ